MYRFLIIDDEPVVREGISETIDWNRHGFELVGACRDGREGLAAVEELKPDVVLTDVCMPFVDGLELAATIGEQYPTIKTLLLTGYDEFEYAREAVKLKVRDFLLKPITADELREILDTLRREIDHERDHREMLERLHAQVQASLPVYRERFLNRLVEGRVSPRETERSVDLLDIDLTGPVYTTLIVDIDPLVADAATVAVSDVAARAAGESTNGAARDDRLLALAVEETVGELTRGIAGTVSFSTAADETIVLFSHDDPERSMVLSLDLAETIADCVQRELSRTVSIGIGDPVEEIDGIPRSYGEARTALEHRFVLGANQIITIQQVRGDVVTSVGTDRSTLRDRFLRSLKAGTIDVDEILGELLGTLLVNGEEPDQCAVTMHRLLADTINALEAIGIDYREIPSFQGNPFDQLSRMKTLDEAARWFSSFVQESRRHLAGRRRRHSERKAEEATAYIEAHFAEPDLSLADVCNALAVSKSYLSPIFKAYTGMTFVEYLTARRVDRAKELLGPGDMKIYEVAGHVGFRDAHYFSLTFKKQTGETPREYQETVRRSVG